MNQQETSNMKNNKLNYPVKTINTIDHQKVLFQQKIMSLTECIKLIQQHKKKKI